MEVHADAQLDSAGAPEQEMVRVHRSGLLPVVVDAAAVSVAIRPNGALLHRLRLMHGKRSFCARGFGVYCFEACDASGYAVLCREQG